MIEIPERFVQVTVDREGDPGRRWIESLPGLLEEFLQRWNCTPAAPLFHGQVGVILPVRRRDGSPCVLKISFPHPGNVHEPIFLSAWGGRGAVMLQERDDAQFAMLLEQVAEDTVACLDDDAAIAVSGELARRLAVPAPPDLPRLSDQAGEWEEAVGKDSARQGNPLQPRIIETAVATIRELGHDQPDTLVHGDLHYGNILRADREPWLVVDPKGFVGDPAYDALTALTGGVYRLLAADNLKSELRRQLAIFADAAQLSRERVYRWVQARTVMASQEARDLVAAAWEIQTLERFAEFLT